MLCVIVTGMWAFVVVVALFVTATSLTTTLAWHDVHLLSLSFDINIYFNIIFVLYSFSGHK